MLRIIIDMLFPSRCAACGRPVGSIQHNICSACADKIVIIQDGCPVCAGPMAEGRCKICPERAFYPSKNMAIAEYGGVMKELLHKLKFSGMRRLHVPIGRMVLNELARHAVPADIITCVPMNTRKKRKRGFNQSELIAKLVAKKSGIPYLPLMKEKRKSETQRELGLRHRFINVINRYSLKKGRLIREKTILIIDDVFTTGATINECARVLLAAGAREVFSVTVARSNITTEGSKFGKNESGEQYNY